MPSQDGCGYDYICHRGDDGDGDHGDYYYYYYGLRECKFHLHGGGDCHHLLYHHDGDGDYGDHRCCCPLVDLGVATFCFLFASLKFCTSKKTQNFTRNSSCLNKTALL